MSSYEQMTTGCRVLLRLQISSIHAPALVSRIPPSSTTLTIELRRGKKLASSSPKISVNHTEKSLVLSTRLSMCATLFADRMGGFTECLGRIVVLVGGYEGYAAMPFHSVLISDDEQQPFSLPLLFKDFQDQVCEIHLSALASFVEDVYHDVVSIVSDSESADNDNEDDGDDVALDISTLEDDGFFGKSMHDHYNLRGQEAQESKLLAELVQKNAHIKSMEAELQELKQKTATYSDAYAKRTEEARNLAAKLAEAKVSLAALSTEVESARSQHGRIADEEHGRLTEDHGRLTEDHGRLTEKYLQLEDEHSRLTEEHGRLTEEHDRLTEEHDRLTEEHGRLTEEHGRLTEEHGRLTGDHGRLTEEHGRLTEEHGRLTEDHGRLTEEHGRLAVEVSDLRASLDLAESMAASEAFGAELSGSQELRRLEAEVLSLRAANEAMAERAEETELQLLSDNTALHSQLKELMKEKEALRSAEETEALSVRVTVLEAEVLSLRAANEAMAERAEETELQLLSDNTAFKQEVDELKEEKAELVRKMLSLEQENLSSGRLRVEASEIDGDEVRRLRDENAELKRVNEELLQRGEDDMVDMMADNRALKQQLDDVEKSRSDDVARSTELEQEVMRLQLEIFRCEERASDLQRSLDEASAVSGTSVFGDLEEELRRARLALDEKEEECNAILQDLIKSRLEYAQVASDADESRRLFAQMETQVSVRNELIERLEGELAAAKKKRGLF